MLPGTGWRGGSSSGGSAFFFCFFRVRSCAASSMALVSNSWVAARVNSSTSALLPAASAASSAACAAARAAGSISAEKSGMSPSSTLRAGGSCSSGAAAGGSAVTGLARRMRARRAPSAPIVCISAGAASCGAGSSASNWMTPVGSDASGGRVGAASWRRSVRCCPASPAAGRVAGGGATGAGASKSSIGSKSAVWSASLVGGVRRRSENRTVLPRLLAASDTTSSGRSCPGRKVMQESVSCRPNRRRRSRSRIWLAMKVSFISGGRAQATAPRRSQTSTKGHWPTLAGM